MVVLGVSAGLTAPVDLLGGWTHAFVELLSRGAQEMGKVFGC